jgi:hypothetical protein
MVLERQLGDGCFLEKESPVSPEQDSYVHLANSREFPRTAQPRWFSVPIRQWPSSCSLLDAQICISILLYIQGSATLALPSPYVASSIFLILSFPYIHPLHFKLHGLKQLLGNHLNSLARCVLYKTLNFD